MPTSRRTGLLALTLLAAAFRLIAESPQDSFAVSNWAAPPFWVPPAERIRSTESKHLLEPAAAAAGNPSLAFHAVTPCRIADTRGFGFAGPYGPPSLTAGATRSFAVTSPGTSCGIPSGVAAVSFNFAVVNLAAAGNLVAFPTGAPTPNVSSLNWTPVEGAISNAAVIALGSDSISVVVNGPVGSTVDLIIDVNGYYAADPVVSSLNGNSGALHILAGSDIGVVTSPPNITIGVNAASSNTAGALVRRDVSGNFSAGTITAALNGNATGFTGALSGDVTGTQGATVVSSVGGSTAANVHTAEQLANAATASNTANAIVRRDALRDIVVHRITATGGYTQPGTGGESLKTIRGQVNTVGAIQTGSGFTVVKNGTGDFTLAFTVSLSGTPTVVVTAFSSSATICTVNGLSSTGAIIRIFDVNGAPIDRSFGFTAIGD